MIQSLHRQAIAFRALDPESPTVTLFPIEVLICFDSEKVSSETIIAMAPGAEIGDTESLSIRHCEFPGAEYYELKNLGAKQAHGDLFLFMDSDVVPEDDWLKNIWERFESHDYKIVAGITYIKPKGIYQKATALHWVFKPPPVWRDTRSAESFWANNVCFRRGTFERYPFPVLQSSSRGACQMLMDSLNADGVPIHVNGAARVTHPAPAGMRGYLERALAQGRDRVLWHQQFSSWWMQAVPAAFLRWLKHTAAVTVEAVRYHRRYQLALWEVPAALAVSWLYYSVFLVGEILTHVAPDYAKKSFRV
jgi:hypothetical protein